MTPQRKTELAKLSLIILTLVSLVSMFGTAGALETDQITFTQALQRAGFQAVGFVSGLAGYLMLDGQI